MEIRTGALRSRCPDAREHADLLEHGWRTTPDEVARVKWAASDLYGTDGRKAEVDNFC